MYPGFRALTRLSHCSSKEWMGKQKLSPHNWEKQNQKGEAWDFHKNMSQQPKDLPIGLTTTAVTRILVNIS